MYCTSELDRRLLSISALSAKGLHVTFRDRICEIRNDQEVVTMVTQKGKLFVLECNTLESASTDRCMLKRTISHVVKVECWKVQVALGIDSRASTYARTHEMF